jgi:hypothetical protein
MFDPVDTETAPEVGGSRLVYRPGDATAMKEGALGIKSYHYTIQNCLSVGMYRNTGLFPVRSFVNSSELLQGSLC